MHVSTIMKTMKAKIIGILIIIQPLISLAVPDSTFVLIPNSIVHNFPENDSVFQKILDENHLPPDSIPAIDTLDDYYRLCLQMDELCNTLIHSRIEFTDEVDKLNIYNFAPDYIPMWSDSVYADRISCLNMQTPIDLLYNKEVKRYIDVYTVNRRQTTERMLGLAELYFPIFEEYLDKYDMPLELKYLPIVESALNPKAGSRAGAKGLWQFMYSTGKIYGLTQTSYIDDRFDPYKATEAACLYLKDLYSIYGDWLLALAAYNSGTGNVNKAIRRSGGKRNYWLIWPYLPRETRGYVPAFSAVAYVMNFAPEHNIYPKTPLLLAHETDTIIINDVLSFEQINEVIGTPIETIEFLNPAFKLDIIPATKEKTYTLKLPTKDILTFVSDPNKVFSYKTKSGIDRDKILNDIKKASEAKVHIVKSGENLSAIASKYNTTVKNIMAWNTLKSTKLNIGQKLIIYPGGYNK